MSRIKTKMIQRSQVSDLFVSEKKKINCSSCGTGKKKRLTIMCEKDLGVDGGGVHEDVPGLGGQHAPNHPRYRHCVEPSTRRLQVKTTFYANKTKFTASIIYEIENPI